MAKALMNLFYLLLRIYQSARESDAMAFFCKDRRGKLQIRLSR